MVVGGALVHVVVYYQVPAGHSGYNTHLVAQENHGGMRGNICENAVDVFLEMLVEIAQRLVEN